LQLIQDDHVVKEAAAHFNQPTFFMSPPQSTVPVLVMRILA
jgi:hypothetical protein